MKVKITILYSSLTYDDNINNRQSVWQQQQQDKGRHTTLTYFKEKYYKS